MNRHELVVNLNSGICGNMFQSLASLMAKILAAISLIGANGDGSYQCKRKLV